jgi:putative ABC transport system permease protein
MSSGPMSSGPMTSGPMTATTVRAQARPAAGTRDGGVPARRAVIRWALRLFRREWRQQLLVLGMLTVAVAATVWGVGVATNTPPPRTATYGTASAAISLPGGPRLAGEIAAINSKYGPVDVIENQALNTASTQPVELRAQDPHGRFGGPLLTLDQGRYPAGPGQVAVTSQVAKLYNLRVGSVWRQGGQPRTVTGIVENPTDLNDAFALVAPGRVAAPTQVTILLEAPRGAGQPQVRRGPPPPVFAGLPANASVALASQANSNGAISPATIVLVIAVLGLVFIGLVAVAGFTVLAQRRLRALGMISALGASERNVRLVMTANGAAVGVIAAIAGLITGAAAWFAYRPSLETDTAHRIDPLNLPWWALAAGIVLAVATSILAARRPARTAARVPVVAALSGRPPAPKAVHR